jgi:hypothetical protein
MDGVPGKLRQRGRRRGTDSKNRGCPNTPRFLQKEENL